FLLAGGRAHTSSALRGLEAAEALADVVAEASLRLLAVVPYVDATLGLATDDVGHRLAHRAIVRRMVVRLAVLLRIHQVQERLRSRQAPRVCSQDAVGAPLHRSASLCRVRSTA